MTDDLIPAALLDEEGLFLRMEALPEAELTDRHLPQIADCDLPPGKYKWDAERQQFLPAGKKSPAAAPDATRAIVKALDAIAKHIALPEESLRFIAEYKQTFDFKGQ